MVNAYSKIGEAEYWSSFYENHEFKTGSTFFEFISEMPELPQTIIDIGCGEGRDSLAFARVGKRVLGLDRSDVGIEGATEKAISEGVNDSLDFGVCDVADGPELTRAIEHAREKAGGGNVCFYMRFFLHSIPEETQDILLATISAQAQSGDVFAVEFRTDKDKDHSRVFGDTHYRRYQNASDFSNQLQTVYGWGIEFETESRGLSPYKDEDPTLYRAVAIWRPRENNTA